MKTTALQWLGYTLIVATATLLAGCSDDTPVGPNRGPGFPRTPEPGPAAEQIIPAAITPANTFRSLDLSACPRLEAPADTELALHVFAAGVQIYRWNGTTWTFVAPSALLSADANGTSTVGTHYAGPTWESNSGGKVVGAVIERCTPNPNAIPWLSLGAVSNTGPGVFSRVTFIQRVNTAGGNAPAAPGVSVGAEARVPYTTEYLFYRTK